MNETAPDPAAVEALARATAERVYNHGGYHASPATTEDAMRAFVHGAKWASSAIARGEVPGVTLAADREPCGFSLGCCTACGGSGRSGATETNGRCWDCRGTGHVHLATDQPEDTVRGIRWRVETACEGYAHLMDADVPHDADDDSYLRGAHDAAEGIRSVLATDQPGVDRG